MTREWHPATTSEVVEIVEGDLATCDAEQLDTFRKYSVKPYLASILRYGNHESVVVVAKKAGEVIYWEDIEEGFNLSPLGSDGEIVEHWCNQDELGTALNNWIEGRARLPRTGPPQSVT